ncbi:MAG: transglutaminase family protein [Planctomycetales bacterium]
MLHPIRVGCVGLILVLWGTPGWQTVRVGLADEPAPAAGGASALAFPGVEKLTEAARKSVVVVTVEGRDGGRQNLGSGFIVASDGLIATNMHVIGEARPIAVQLADGKKLDVTQIAAYDRTLDLALIRVDVTNLPALPLGDSSTLKQGQPVVALGNPHGLKHSVVVGVVSGTREIDGREMIQLAIPIEPGNSGGPLLDVNGNVHGILTMKSAVTDNLGFAMPVNALKPLIDRPNPTTMERWLTIGALDPQEWKPLFGARWRQRAGRILVDGRGQGFGGRSLCLSEQAVPDQPFDLAVSVKLNQEEGAAGLVFCSDGNQVHYGFYPSAGKLRLSRFDGPDVSSWQVLAEVSSEHYRPGDWNSLRVRFEPGRIRCFVNNQLTIESADDRLQRGQVGLAKFRDTEAEFRSFRMGLNLAEEGAPGQEVVARIDQLTTVIPAVGPLQGDLVDKLSADGPASVMLLRDRAKKLEQQAAQLRRLAQSVHQRKVVQELVQALDREESQVDLYHAALLVALLDNDEVNVEDYRKELERVARDVAKSVPAGASAAEKLTVLNRYLFEEQGYHGSRGEYYHRSNSYVNEVLDDREGLPITLSVIFMELARRLDLRVVGIGLPGHFVVRFEPPEGDRQLIDVFERGAAVSLPEAEQRIREALGRPPLESDFVPATKRAIIVRILYNLLGLAQRSQDADGVLRYAEAILAISPDNPELHWMRAMLLFRSGQREEALRETQWLLEHRPQGVDLNEVDQLRRLLERPGSP